MGATGSALFLTALVQGRSGVVDLLRRFLIWRVKLRWYVFAILGLPVIKVLIGYLLSGSGKAFLAFSPASLALYPAAYIPHFFFGPLFEEAAWRGFALPRLQGLHGPLKGTFILGILWGVWHLPVYLPSNIQNSGMMAGIVSFTVFLIVTLAMTVIFTWLFNNTKGSLLLAVLLHACIDGTATYIHILVAKNILPSSAAGSIEFGLMLGCIGLAVLLILVTRGRLGYDTYRRSAEFVDYPVQA
ncbi:MAG: CPBP family intramembrane glutamic endopeptidase [Desulfonatronovibrionaceae bacterium]